MHAENNMRNSKMNEFKDNSQSKLEVDEEVYKKNKLLEFDIKTHKINNLSPYALNIL